MLKNTWRWRLHLQVLIGSLHLKEVLGIQMDWNFGKLKTRMREIREVSASITLLCNIVAISRKVTPFSDLVTFSVSTGKERLQRIQIPACSTIEYENEASPCTSFIDVVTDVPSTWECSHVTSTSSTAPDVTNVATYITSYLKKYVSMAPLQTYNTTSRCLHRTNCILG